MFLFSLKLLILKRRKVIKNNYTNCLIEAIKAKIKNPKIILKIWIDHKQKYHGFHIYWEDNGRYFHHSAINGENIRFNILHYIWHEGSIKELYLKYERKYHINY